MKPLPPKETGKPHNDLETALLISIFGSNYPMVTIIHSPYRVKSAFVTQFLKTKQYLFVDKYLGYKAINKTRE